MHPATDHGTGDSTAASVVVRRLGRRGYADACALQEARARAVESGARDELLYVEHPPVITLGRGTAGEQLLSTAARLAAAGISLARTDRGGGATYHGPGQLVGYPIVHLRRRAVGVRTYLRALEGALITTLRAQDIDAYARAGLTGVWSPAGKLASIGVAVRRGVTRHGFALNVNPDLSAFRHIVPCGIPEPVTSLERLGWRGRVAALQQRVVAELAGALDRVTEPAGAPRAFPSALLGAQPTEPVQ